MYQIDMLFPRKNVPSYTQEVVPSMSCCSAYQLFSIALPQEWAAQSTWPCHGRQETAEESAEGVWTWIHGNAWKVRDSWAGREYSN